MIFHTTPAWRDHFDKVAHCAANTILPMSVPSEDVNYIRALCRRVSAVLRGRTNGTSPDKSRSCWTVQELAQYLNAALRSYEEHGDFSVPEEISMYLLLKDATRDLSSALQRSTAEEK